MPLVLLFWAVAQMNKVVKQLLTSLLMNPTTILLICITPEQRPIWYIKVETALAKFSQSMV